MNASSGKRRDSSVSRQAILDAAAKLFGEKGFARTTTREIGETAGLDPTLIARYFGNKASLYLTVLRAEHAAQNRSGTVPDILDPDRLVELLDRLQHRGPGPVFESALHAHADQSVQREARQALTERVVQPLRHRMSGPDADLRAEITAAAFIGIAVGRHSGAFPRLAEASSTELANIITNLFADYLD